MLRGSNNDEMEAQATWLRATNSLRMQAESREISLATSMSCQRQSFMHGLIQVIISLSLLLCT